VRSTHATTPKGQSQFSPTQRRGAAAQAASRRQCEKASHLAARAESEGLVF
jgi:hypothetical protein